LLAVYFLQLGPAIFLLYIVALAAGLFILIGKQQSLLQILVEPRDRLIHSIGLADSG
jgi:hypothetical protein